jgi:centromeric protein E
MVAIRMRPLTEKEQLELDQIRFRPSSDKYSVQELDERGQVVKLWDYDKTFGPQESNSAVFEDMGAPLVDAALDGYNGVLFMYGQTASGRPRLLPLLAVLTVHPQARLTRYLGKETSQE